MDLSQTQAQMGKILEVLKADLSTVRTGRAAPSLVENIIINAYGGTSKMRVLELATVGVLDAQTITISPYDASIIGEIQKGIMESNVGLTPVIDGQLIRISIPPLSEERRKELVHLVNQKLEGGKVQVRQVRHTGMEELKKLSLGEDEEKRLEKEIQKLTDDTISEIDSLGNKKEEELMQI